MAFSPKKFALEFTQLWVVITFIGCSGQPVSLQSNVNSSISGMYLVTDIEPQAAVPGDNLVIKGTGFTESIKITIAGADVAILSRVGEKELVVTVPAGTPGLTSLVVSLDEEQSSHIFIRLSTDGTPVMAGADSKQMCKDQKVYSTTGALVEGERECENNIFVCNAEGQTDCIASDKFPSVSVAGLEERIIEGQVVAGIAGKAQKHQPCAKDGDKDCVANESFPAADFSGLHPEQILTGLQIAGVSGTYTPDFPAAVNVLNTDTVNGSPGTLTLPTAASVLVTSGTFGAGGTASTPTLILPAGMNVLSGTGAFGVGGTGSIPAYAPDFPNTQNVLSTDTVNGLSGTLTLPPETTVLSGNTYGSAGSSHHGTLPNRGNWNLATGFPGFGYYSTVSNLPVNADIRNSATVLGVGGSVVPTPANCSSDGQTGCVATTGFKSASSTVAIASNIKSGVKIAGVDGSYGGGASATCLTDGAAGCMVDGANFVAADVKVATPGNIRKSISIAGVSGTYMGGASVSVTEPTGNDDFIVPGTNFTLQFSAFRPVGDPMGTISLFARADSLTTGCTGDPGSNAWTQIVTGLSEGDTSFIWTGVPKGTYHLCAKFDNGVNQAYEVSSGKLFAKDSIIFATGITFTGDGFSGVTGADSLCRAAASSAALPSSASYKAIISNNTQHARDRISLGARIFNSKAEQVATALNFWSGSHASAIYRTDQSAAQLAWTGSTAFGHSTGENCNDWSSNSGGLVGGSGAPANINFTWVMSSYASCNSTRSLYCIGDQ